MATTSGLAPPTSIPPPMRDQKKKCLVANQSLEGVLRGADRQLPSALGTAASSGEQPFSCPMRKAKRREKKPSIMQWP